MNEISLFDYKKIINNKGNIFKLLDGKSFSSHLKGELYISQINSGEVKAWRKHKLYEALFIVVAGEVVFKCIDNKNNLIMNKMLSLDSCKLIKVDPNLWYGFKGISKSTSTLLVLINGLHRESEIERMEYDDF
tara:strand:+ start:1622 stop:2020 length:399 start_codon:yes stop_codon:yes gene_type:complete